jgi:hypothetical protein
MLALSVAVAGLQAWQARLPLAHDGLRSRLVVAWLCYVQPLVRSWARYRTRFAAHRHLSARDRSSGGAPRLPLWRPRRRAYWDDRWRERLSLLERCAGDLTSRGWSKLIDSGWTEWDLEFSRDPWTVVRVATAQEDHGAGKRLIRVRFILRPDGVVGIALLLSGLAGLLAAAAGAWPAVVGSVALAGVGVGLWWRGARRAAEVVVAFDRAAAAMGLIRVQESRRPWHSKRRAGEGRHE